MKHFMTVKTGGAYLDKIRFHCAGLIDEKEELLERFFEEEYL